jgi:RNA polymerase sigma-70 factor (ECF subfamily)
MTISAPETEAAPDARDARIVDALTRKDRLTAARLLVEAHAGALGSTCMALLGSQSEAEEALRETLLVALSGVDELRGDGTLRARLLGLARRRCALRVEARSRERSARSAVPAAEHDAGAPLSPAPHARLRLSELRPSEREALVLRFVGGASTAEVGMACGIDEASAQKRLSRGLDRLRELMNKDQP